MNSRQLQSLGVSEELVPVAITAIRRASAELQLRGKEIEKRLKDAIATPDLFVADAVFGELAAALKSSDAPPPDLPEPLEYPTWGTEIDAGAHAQMRQACQLPMAVAGALMPDAHIGYGLPIGGVLALEGAVVPFAVGVDIACRMKLSILDIPVAKLTTHPQMWDEALENGTRFGIGCTHKPPKDHPVMDADWTVCRVTREHKDKARTQLGTSGSGNHFVEFGVLTLPEDDRQLGIPAGKYTALLSHSGSRGVGSSVCDTYSRIAQSRLPKKYSELGRLAWLDLDSEAGQEYWSAMSLMGDYAAANHDVIHKTVCKLLGSGILAGVENHHNFAWKEQHAGREVVVHRKGATPAGAGVLGVIPGSMGTPAFVVRGKGNAASLHSASHGAGRAMSRTKARDLFRFGAIQKELAQQGVRVLSAGSDEVPGVYKDIHQVMQQQQDLVDVVAQFDPRVVKMCGDGSAAED